MAVNDTHIEQLADLKTARAGEFRGTAFAVLRAVRDGVTRAGRPFFDAEVVDASGGFPVKVWDDAQEAMGAMRSLEDGAVVKIRFALDDYRGAKQLVVSRIRRAAEGEADLRVLLGAGYERAADLRCESLVFDIETVPDTDLRKVPPTIAQAVTKHADRSESEEAKVMGLSPWFGKIVSLAVGDGEAGEEAMPVTALVVPPEGRADAEFPPWIRPMSEPQLLEAFWFLASQASRVVTYNGRGFDVPFLVARSLVHNIPVRVDSLARSNKRHLDLLPLVGRAGAFRASGPASLDVVCWALGITSPKGDMDGSMVAPTYARGDIERIAEYNVGDVEATARIYRRARALLTE